MLNCISLVSNAEIVKLINHGNLNCNYMERGKKHCVFFGEQVIMCFLCTLLLHAKPHGLYAVRFGSYSSFEYWIGN